MIKDLFLVRHGVCTGNVADRASFKGDHSHFTEDISRCHSDLWPLTDDGVRQSRQAGKKILELVPNVDCLLCSGVLRATQTAEEMQLVGVCRCSDSLLRERNWGGLENLPYDKRNKIFAKAFISPTEDSMSWSPPGGENMNSLVSRMKFFLHQANLMYAGKRVVAVTHGGPIQAMRVIHNNIREDEYVAFIGGNNYIRNCQIIYYSDIVNGKFTSERIFYMNSRYEWIEPDIEKKGW